METGSALLTFRQGLAAFGSGLLDALLPPRCLACGCLVERPGALCGDCWESIEFIGPPLCACCGLPFDYDLGPDALCGQCSREPPPLERVRAVMVYGDTSRRLVAGFKYRDRTEGGPAFAAWMSRVGAGLLEEAEVILPVPLHWTRLFTRRYNQSAILARALGRAAGRPVAMTALARTRRTPPQVRLSAGARQRNVSGAFRVRSGREAEIADKRVLLIDDVLTTGSTLSACARALRRAGASGVDGLVLARVVPGR